MKKPKQMTMSARADISGKKAILKAIEGIDITIDTVGSHYIELTIREHLCRLWIDGEEISINKLNHK